MDSLVLSKRLTYDNKNNMIESIEFIQEIPRYIIEREIEYYD